MGKRKNSTQSTKIADIKYNVFEEAEGEETTHIGTILNPCGHCNTENSLVLNQSQRLSDRYIRFGMVCITCGGKHHYYTRRAASG